MFFFNHYQKIYIWQTVGGRGGLFKPWWNFCVEFYNVILICAWLDFFFFFFFLVTFLNLTLIMTKSYLKIKNKIKVL